jgi:hypothetical protein
MVLALDFVHMTAKLVSSFNHSTPLVAPSQGDFQPVTEGDWFVGWGQEPYFSEFSSGGQLLFDAHLPLTYQSYTVFKFPWSGTPTQLPRLAVRARSHGGLVAYASWNGSTSVARWQLLGGASPHALTPVGAAARSGFETSIAIATAPRYVSVQALDAHGQVLGASAPMRP